MSHQALALVRREVERGNVTERSHGPLSLFKYSPSCAYDKGWNKTNKRCRGIVFDVNSGTIVGRPFDKFFNLNEVSGTKAKYVLSRAKRTPFRVTEKMDGSMMSVFFYNGEWQTATPGSMESPQALYARRVLLPRYNLSKVPTDVTLVCEFIAPMDRQDKVVEYGNREELVLLTALENKWEQTEVPFGRVFLFAQNTGMTLVPVWAATYENFLDLPIPNNTEGYVISFEDSFRVKMKSMAYVKAHRLISEFGSKHILDYIREGSYQGAVKQLPESKRKYFDDIFAQVMQVKGEIELEAAEWVAKCDPTDMKKSAFILQDAPEDIRPLVFGALRGKSMEDYLWKVLHHRFKE